jgi:GDP-L-fucose synthase
MGLILITGGTGFLGRAVLQRFSDKRVIAPNRLMLNLLDQKATEQYLEEKSPNIVVHLAGTVAGIGGNMARPGQIAYENMCMGINLVEAARKTGVKLFVNVGTVCGYPENCPVPFKEEDIGTGKPEVTNRAYGLCKNYLAELLMAYNKEYGMMCANLYPTNMAGFGDNFDEKTSHVIPALIKKFDEAKDSVTLFGDGSATRSFLSVRDCAEAIYQSLQWRYIKPINVGPSKDISIKELAYKIRSIMGLDHIEIKWDTTKPNGQPKRLLDNSLIKSTGWEPKQSLTDMIQEEVMYYRTVVKI